MKLKTLAIACAGVAFAASASAQSPSPNPALKGTVIYGGGGKPHTGSFDPMQAARPTGRDIMKVVPLKGDGPYEYQRIRGEVSLEGDNVVVRLPTKTEPLAKKGAGPIYKYQYGAYLYSALPSMGLKVNQSLMGTMNDRLGTGALDSSREAQTWGRSIGQHYSHVGDFGRKGKDPAPYDASNQKANGTGFKQEIGGLQIGTDLYRDGQNRMGAYMALGKSEADVYYRWRKIGKNTAKSQALGLYYTHADRTGWYVDTAAQASMSQFKTKENYTTLAQADLDRRGKGWGFAMQAETGYRFDLGSGYAITPKAGLDYQHVRLGNLKRSAGSLSPKFNAINSIETRLGLRAAKTWEMAPQRTLTAFLEPGVVHDFARSATTKFVRANGSSVTLHNSLGGTRGTISGGLEGSLTKSTSLGLSGGYEQGLGKRNGHEGWNSQLTLRTAF